MPSKAHVVHHIPGRVRLRIPAKRRDRAYFEQVKARLEQIHLISAVEVNPASASVLVRYAGPLANLLVEAAGAGLHELAEISDDLPPVPPVTDTVIERLIDLDKQIIESSGASLNGRAMLLLGLVAAAGVQLYRGQLLGPAVPLLWYAASALGGVLPHRTEPSKALAPVPAG